MPTSRHTKVPPLRLVGGDDRAGRAEPRRSSPDAWDLAVNWPAGRAHDVERAIDDAQLRIDELRALLHPSNDDDRPRAA